MSEKSPSPHFDESICERCDGNDSVYVSLNCGHNFCLVCMSYVVIKCRAQGNKEDQVTCSVCKQVTQLDTESVEAINTTIQEILLPKLNSYREPIQEVSAENADEQSEANNKSSQQPEPPSSMQPPPTKPLKRYSEDPSYDHITPSTKYFFSKCDSPVAERSNKQYCQLHPLQQLSFVCLTCGNEILCLKCVIAAKHKSHLIKNVKKGVEFLTEQISMRKLELNEKLEYYEMLERRYRDKKQAITEKWERSKQQITDTFFQVVNRVKRREAELLQICNQHYNTMELEIEIQLGKLAKRLQTLSSFKSDLKLLTRTGYSTNETERSDNRTKPSDFFTTYNRIKDSLQTALRESSNPQPHNSKETVLWIQEKELTPIFQAVNKISLAFGHSHPIMQKKPHTKYTSLNSSREKKKKYAKTEEDEMFQCGLKRKTEHNIDSSEKIDKMSRKGSNKKELPGYVSKFLEKQQSFRPDILDSSLMYEFQNGQGPKLNGSKMSSTKILSKSIVPTEGVHKKKRAERKTTNPLESLKHQKNTFQTKRKKPVN